MFRPEGFLSITAITLDGRSISSQEAVDRQLVVPAKQAARSWGLKRHEIPLGPNLFTASGRQALAYAFGFRSPIVNYVCTQFGIGTGTSAPQTSDSGLETPVQFYSSPGNPDPENPDLSFKPVTSVTWAQPLVATVQIDVAANEANGVTITELGLFSGTDGTGGQILMARKVIAGYVKTNATGFSLTWRVRF